MSEDLETRINKLEAVEEIKNLHARYVYAMDSISSCSDDHLDRILDLFSDPFEAEYVGFGVFKTKKELRRYLETARDNVIATCHSSTTPLIEAEGDHAFGTWYFFGPATLRTPDGPAALWEQGKYEARYAKVRGKWKMTYFKVTMMMLTPYEKGWVKDPFGPAAQITHFEPLKP